MGALTLVAAQLPACTGVEPDDVATACDAVRAAATAGADLVLLPELATVPYFGGEPGGAYRQHAQAVDGELVSRLARLAAELRIAVAFGFFEAAEGTFYNSVVVLDRFGTVVPAVDRAGAARPTARKLHLPVGDDPPPGFDEAAHFAPGPALGVHDLDTASGPLRVGVLVCYDRRFPECWRELRGLGADVALVPMAGDGGDGGDFVVAELRTHSRENGLVALAASKVGVETATGQAVGNVGESLIVTADGRVVAERHDADGPGLVTAVLDLATQRGVRRRLRYFEHRRLDLFSTPFPSPPPTPGALCTEPS